jgi:hypothetical protein
MLCLLWPAVYADGTTEYNAHNLFGTAMTMHTHEAAVEVMGRRPFMMVRWVACLYDSPAVAPTPYAHVLVPPSKATKMTSGAGNSGQTQ